MRYHFYNNRINANKPTATMATIRELFDYVREAIDMRADWKILDTRKWQQCDKKMIMEMMGK